MTLLGHRSPKMTIRYARLASPTLKAAYDQAAGKIARRIPVAPAGRPAAPDRVEWLAAEMLKTRVAHGYCSRDLAAEACPERLPAGQRVTDVQGHDVLEATPDRHFRREADPGHNRRPGWLPTTLN